MAEQSSPSATFDLPPVPEFAADAAADEKRYFDPEKWDADIAHWPGSVETDPISEDRGRLTGEGSVALFVSDFHIGDGTAGGDDFLESHILRDEELGLHTGFFPPGESRAGLFVRVLSFARARAAAMAGPGAGLDIVLHGDLMNFIELKGRGGTLVSPKHRPFFQALAASRPGDAVFYLRGNHDYVVPSGPWQRGEFYVNDRLRVLAEHGDFWDKENWPPGPLNKGSRLVIEAGAAFEVHSAVLRDGTIKYLMSGLDNLRPWNNNAVEAFLDRRSRYTDIAAVAALMARLDYVGAADDSAAYQGARQRRQGAYRDWLMVQGHTHVPAFVPGVYGNTGTWISTLVDTRGEETHIDAFPFLLVSLDAEGRRTEEYFMVCRDRAGVPRVELHTPGSVNALRQRFGYKPIEPL